jgi:ATP-binding cassette subfamily F protein uup
LEPDSGTLSLGAGLVMATLDQSRASLDPEASVKEALTGGHGDTVQLGTGTRHVISYMKDFLFTPEQAGTKLRLLSGGERARLLLARALAQPSNLLVLDEPTNDLDLETLDLLQEMIADYPGTVLLVSHDRDFLDRTATAILMAEGEGRFADYAGGYSDMVVQRGEGVTARAAAPAARSAKVPGGLGAPNQQKGAPRPGGLAQDRAANQKPAPKRKLSFKDQHALEKLPAQIAALEAEIATLHDALSDGKLYAREPKRFADLTAKLEAAQADLAAAEARWLELEMMREELEG